jgi:hypothetical protein
MHTFRTWFAMFEYINTLEVTNIKKTEDGKTEFACMGNNEVLSIEDATATTMADVCTIRYFFYF